MDSSSPAWYQVCPPDWQATTKNTAAVVPNPQKLSAPVRVAFLLFL